ncbi:hypothetical protein PANO111632_14485 [Paracoccus nototheniae]|uniref:Uncharacterized protein n=1 Tax=Paracoccus nototheniae TaxID=2489002 RepID=A0ABW4DTR7_9RHOB|nr:hypothetical protein [Paracoccus nototheniae]
MKAFAIALTALTFAAGAATAATTNDSGNGSNLPAPADVQAAAKTKQVPAASVMTSTELARAGISGDTLVTVTSFGTEGQVANLYRDR